MKSLREEASSSDLAMELDGTGYAKLRPSSSQDSKRERKREREKERKRERKKYSIMIEGAKMLASSNSL